MAFEVKMAPMNDLSQQFRVAKGRAFFGLRGLTKDITEGIYRNVLARFQNQNDPWGRGWAEWSASYMKKKMRKCPNTPKLICSGRMYRSIRYEHKGLHGKVEISLPENYPWYHHTGTSRMPARAVFPITRNGILDLAPYNYIFKYAMRKFNKRIFPF